MNINNTLTPRELEVIRLLAQGLKDSEIAKILIVETTTVKTFLNRIFPKLAANTRTEAAFTAISMGLIDCPCHTNRLGKEIA